MDPEYGKNIYVFIDASNVWAAQKIKGKFFNLEKLRNFLKETYSADTIKVFYYTAYPAEGTRDYSMDNKHKFFTYLSKGLGFEVQKKELKRITVHTMEGDRVEEKGNMDVEMTIDVIHHMAKYDTAIFFSGDSDFLSLVTYLKNAKKKVFIYSSKNNVSQELRTGADGYIDVLSIRADIWGNELRFRDQK
jgi:uncharacterized LabA/DUF88 family protein